MAQGVIWGRVVPASLVADATGREGTIGTISTGDGRGIVGFSAGAVLASDLVSFGPVDARPQPMEDPAPLFFTKLTLASCPPFSLRRLPVFMGGGAA